MQFSLLSSQSVIIIMDYSVTKHTHTTHTNMHSHPPTPTPTAQHIHNKTKRTQNTYTHNCTVIHTNSLSHVQDVLLKVLCPPHFSLLSLQSVIIIMDYSVTFVATVM